MTKTLATKQITIYITPAEEDQLEKVRKHLEQANQLPARTSWIFRLAFRKMVEGMKIGKEKEK